MPTHSTSGEKGPKGIKAAAKYVYERYLIGAMSSMAFGLFASLIIGVVFTQIAKIPLLSSVEKIAEITQDKYVIGAAIGAAIAYGLKSRPLVIFSSVVVGALGYELGGPLGSYIAVLISAELAGIVAGKTPVDIILSPLATITIGSFVAMSAAPVLGSFTVWLGELVNTWATLQPFLAGILIAGVVGMTLTSPISSAGLCASIGITGIASGAAMVGCAAQMIGFAAASFKDNNIGGVLSQAFGTSKLQLPNVLRHPQIWLAPSLAGAVLGPISTCVFKLEVNTSAAAGMGTCGLVGPISLFDKMGYNIENFMIVLVLCVIAPIILSLLFHMFFKKIGLVKDGYMELKA